MSYTIKRNVKVALEKESTQGTYVAPQTGDSYVRVLADGLELTPSKEQLDRNVLGLGLSKLNPRQGLKSVSGTIPVYMKSGDTAGEAPEYGVLIESLLGISKSSASSTSKTGHTSSVVEIEDADISKYAVGDIVVIKESGSYHISPISEVDTTGSVANITLAIPSTAGAFSDNVVVESFTTYSCSDNEHPSYSVSKYIEDLVLESAMGVKTTSMSLESFSTGQLATFNFGMEGINYARDYETPQGGTPVYDSSETPVILEACIWQDGVKIEVNEFTLSVENTLGYIQDTCAGKKASRVTERSISGSINPYKQDDDLTQFTNFDTNKPFSLFITAHNPSATAGEYSESISFYLPHCTSTEIGESDLDGVLQDTITFSAGTEDGTIKELFISFS